MRLLFPEENRESFKRIKMIVMPDKDEFLWPPDASVP